MAPWWWAAGVAAVVAVAAAEPALRNVTAVTLVHIPKNGGTSLTKALQAQGLGPRPGIGSRRKIHAPGCNEVHTPPRFFEDQFRASARGTATIATLRHPYERAISQFTWGLQSIWGPELGYGRTAAELNRFVRDSIANASRPVRKRGPFGTDLA